MTSHILYSFLIIFPSKILALTLFLIFQKQSALRGTRLLKGSQLWKLLQMQSLLCQVMVQEIGQDHQVAEGKLSNAFFFFSVC